MKAGWRVVPLGELVEIKPSKREAQSRLKLDEPVSFVPMEDLKELQRSFAPKQVRPLAEVYGGYTYFANDDVLLAKITPCFENGKLSIARHLENGVGFGSSEFMVLRCGQQLDPEYLFYFLSRNEFRETGKSRMTGAVGHRRVPPEFVQAQPIPLPPLDKQKRIVAVLDEAFEGLSRARANAEANLADAQVLALNQLRNLFAECAQLHPFRRIGDVADHCLGKMLDKNKNQGTLRPYLRNINVRWFEVDTSDMLEMRIEDREVERYSAKKGDLLICEGGYPGRAAVWDKEETVFFQKALHRVRFSNPAYATFLMYFLFMKDATGQLKEHFTGSGIQHFTGQALAQFQMPFPDLGTVGKIVSQIEEVDATTSALEHHYQVTISQLDALRQSLLQRAFSGGLT